MIDVVVPLGNGSRWHDNELRYCLRSIEQHLKGYGEIFIIGEKPEWLTNIIHIPFKESSNTKYRERNIYEKIIVACADIRLGKRFIFFNDDHYLLQDIKADEFPYHYKGAMEGNANNRRATDPYGNTLRNTLKVTSNQVNNYDTHCPIVYDKELFATSVGRLDWVVPFGYAIKTVYCYYNGITGEYYEDCKAGLQGVEQLREIVKDRLYFSTAPKMGKALKMFLEELYPNKSKYEY